MSSPSNVVEMKPLPEVVPRTQLVYEEIRRAILEGRLAPGQQIVERSLADLLAVSKTPVREALKQLAVTGLVEQAPSRGMRVRVVNETLVHAVQGARAMIEPPAVGLACPRRNDALIDAAAEALSQASDAAEDGNLASVALANRTFHQTLYSGCQNPVIRQVLDGLQDQTAFISTVGWMSRRTWEEEAVEHEAILTAFADGDAGTATELMKAHIGSYVTRIVVGKESS